MSNINQVIVCVDDEQIILNSVEKQLSRAFPDYQIELAESAEEALEIIDDSIDSDDEVVMIISDEIMPGMKGDELLSQVHKDFPRVINILLAGQAAIDTTVEAINKANLFRFIKKPWEENDLVLAVSKGLEQYDSYIKQEKLFSSFIKLIGTAVDETSEYTGGHVKKVAAIALMIAQHINKADSGPYGDINFTHNEMEELEVAAWVHDIGKITVPEDTLDKATKLQVVYDRIETIKLKIEIAKKDIEINYLKNQLKVSDLNCDVDYLIKLDDDYEKKLTVLSNKELFLEDINMGKEFVSDKHIKYLINVGLHTIKIKGVKQNLLSKDEIMNLAIRKGTLLEKERKIIMKHAYVGYEMLKTLEFPDKMKNVVDIACNHHETLNGTGYPRGLKGEDLSIRDRIMVISDLFEALTSADRPYKKAKPLSEVFKIMGHLVKDGLIDDALVRFFVESGACEKFSKQYLLPNQIDEFVLAF